MLLVLPPKILGGVGDAADYVFENSLKEYRQKIIELKRVLVLLIVIVIRIVLQQVSAGGGLVLEYPPFNEFLDHSRERELLLNSRINKTLLPLIL